MEKTESWQSRWHRLALVWKSFDMQDYFYILLSLWVIFPVVLAALRLLSPYLPWDVVGNQAVTSSTHLCSIYAKYFYILGGVTVCAAIVSLCASFPVSKKALKTAVREMPWHSCLGFMLFWSFLSTLASGNPITCFWGLRYHNDGLSSYIIYAAIYICAYFLAQTGRRMKLLRAVCLSGTFCSVHIFIQAFINLRNGVSTARLYVLLNSVFLNINHCAYLLTAGILCAAGLWLYDGDRTRRPLHLLAYVMQIYALLLNDTFGCYLAVLLSLPMVCLLYWRSGRKLTPAVFLPLCIFLVMTAAQLTGLLPGAPRSTLLNDFTRTYSDMAAIAESGGDGGNQAAVMSGGSDRIGIWVGTLEHIAKRPLFGYGPDAAVQPWSDSGIIRTHNEFLQHAMLLGIPAALAYVAALLTLFLHQWKRLRETEETVLIAAGAVTGYLISSFFGISIFYTTPFLFFLLGLAAGQMKPIRAEMPPSAKAGAARMEAVKADGDRTSGRGTEAAREASGSRKSARKPGTSGAALTAGRKRAACVLILSWAGVTAALTVILYLEGARERADVLNMEIAKSASDTIEEAYNSGMDPSYEFWVDVEEETMNSTDAPPPSAYGKGTIVEGKIMTVGEASSRGYSTQSDYRGCVVRLRANENGDGTYSVIKEWVIVEE